jgi:hypothetical protein
MQIRLMITQYDKAVITLILFRLRLTPSLVAADMAYACLTIRQETWNVSGKAGVTREDESPDSAWRANCFLCPYPARVLSGETHSSLLFPLLNPFYKHNYTNT